MAGAARVWVGPPVPEFVPAGLGPLELVTLREAEGARFALYREPFGSASTPGCDPRHRFENCRTLGRLYLADGTLAAEVDFNALMHRETHLAVHDFTLHERTLYFAEACQTYASEARGQCSDVVAVDLSRTPSRVLWRTRFLVSNAPLLVVGDYLVTGYGFTAERDFVHVVDRRDGRVVLATTLAKAPEALAVNDGVLSVWIYGREAPLHFAMRGFSPLDGPPQRDAAAKPWLAPRP